MNDKKLKHYILNFNSYFLLALLIMYAIWGELNGFSPVVYKAMQLIAFPLTVVVINVLILRQNTYEKFSAVAGSVGALAPFALFLIVPSLMRLFEGRISQMGDLIFALLWLVLLSITNYFSLMLIRKFLEGSDKTVQ